MTTAKPFFQARNGAFDDATTLLVGDAYDSACALLGNISDASRNAVADRIIEEATRGERDPIRLREAGLDEIATALGHWSCDLGAFSGKVAAGFPKKMRPNLVRDFERVPVWNVSELDTFNDQGDHAFMLVPTNKELRTLSDSEALAQYRGALTSTRQAIAHSRDLVRDSRERLRTIENLSNPMIDTRGFALMINAGSIDPVELLKHLIDQAEDRIRQQREIIVHLQSIGADISNARDLLKALVLNQETRLRRLENRLKLRGGEAEIGPMVPFQIGSGFAAADRTYCNEVDDPTRSRNTFRLARTRAHVRRRTANLMSVSGQKLKGAAD